MKILSIALTLVLFSSTPLFSQSEGLPQSRKEQRQERREERQNNREEKRQAREDRRSEKSNNNEITMPESTITDVPPEIIYDASSDIKEEASPAQSTNKEEQAFFESETIKSPTESQNISSETTRGAKQDDDSKNWILWIIGAVAAFLAIVYFRAIMGILSILSIVLVGVYLYKNGLTYKSGAEWFVIVFIFSTFMWFFIPYFRRIWSARCKKCKRLGVMKVYDRRDGVEIATTATKTIKKKINGEVSATYEMDVPATRRTYTIHRQCKRCGYKDYIVESSTTPNY